MSDATISEAQSSRAEAPALPVAQDFFTDTSDLDQLTRALGRIREQIAAAKTIESSILDHLKRLKPHNKMVIDGLDTSSSLSTPRFSHF